MSAAFAQCVPSIATPFREGVDKLRALGYAVDVVLVSGRSSSAHNAKQIVEALDRLAIDETENLVLLGYSKGTPDILQFLVDFPHWANRVDAVISVAGAVNGTPIADRYARLYDELFAKADVVKACPPGDGGVVDSLTRERRMQWIGTNPLPSRVRYFSVVSYASRENLARALRSPWDKLARIDARNDGQLLAQDQVLPGSTLMGYVNADHWNVAARVEAELPLLGGRDRGVAPFPRAALLEAMLLYVLEALPVRQGGVEQPR